MGKLTASQTGDRNIFTANNCSFRDFVLQYYPEGTVYNSVFVCAVGGTADILDRFCTEGLMQPSHRIQNEPQFACAYEFTKLGHELAAMVIL